MEISLGFIVLFFLILFPGLIIRRLFYYGEFSKQFGSGLSLIKLIAIASIPGLINLTAIFFFYNNFISHINVVEIINTCKDINNPEHHLEANSSRDVSKMVSESVFPFFAFLYTSSIIIGLISGRLIRITRIDTKFKLLRFKNYWFYAFSGELTRFKKMKHLNEVNKKHLFTIADILVDADGKTNLYSGVVIDYELNENNCQLLSKVVLQHAERFKQIGDHRERVKIPGKLFVVDCSKLKNINLTYVYEQSASFLESKVPAIIFYVLAVISILLVPLCLFKTEYISWHWYEEYFNLKWYEKFLSYVAVTQLFAIFNPFVKDEKASGYKYVGWRITIIKIIFFVLLSGLLYLLI